MLCKAHGLLGRRRRPAGRRPAVLQRRRGGWRARRASSPAASSGAAVHVAVELATELGKGKMIVAVLPDTGNSYITKFYSATSGCRTTASVDEKAPGRVQRPHRGAHAARCSSPRRASASTRWWSRCASTASARCRSSTPHGRAVGMIHEYDLLNALVGKQQGFHDPIDSLDRAAAGRGEPRGQHQPAAGGLRPGQRGGGEGGRAGGRRSSPRSTSSSTWRAGCERRGLRGGDRGRPEAEARWAPWHADVHMPEVLTQPGFRGGRRWRDVEASQGRLGPLRGALRRGQRGGDRGLPALRRPGHGSRPTTRRASAA